MAQAYVYEDDSAGWRALTAGDLPNSGVTAATYGDSSHVGQFAVDAQGIITAAANIAIAGAPPSGSAGGDLGGSYPTPTVVAAEETGGPTRLAFGAIPDGDFLKRSGSAIIGAASGAGTISDITSTGSTITVSSPTGPTTNVDLPASGVTAATYGSASNVGQFTVDAEGRITAAANVSIGGGVVVGADGWVDDTAETWTFASFAAGPPAVGTFTVAGDLRSKYTMGTRIKLTQTTGKFFVVSADSTFGGGNTTVTISGGTDYTLANAAISANNHSYVINPQGYPSWFAFAAGVAGWAATPTVTARFSVLGRTCILAVGITGTSNATTATAVAPIACGSASAGGAWPFTATSGGTAQATPGRAFIAASSTTVTFALDWKGTAWSSTGTKTVGTTDGIYEI